jgi:hypothetical protein
MAVVHYGATLHQGFLSAIGDYVEQGGGAVLATHQFFYSTSLYYIYHGLCVCYIGLTHHHNLPWILERIWLEEDYISLTQLISLQMGGAFSL